jgi:H+-transporting ATPase
VAGSILGACFLAFCTGVLLIGKFRLGLDMDALQTLAMITMVFGGEAVLYSVREREHIWSSRPGMLVIVATAADILIVSVLATRGIAMHSLPVALVACTLVGATFFAFLLDFVKVPAFRRLQIT